MLNRMVVRHRFKKYLDVNLIVIYHLVFGEIFLNEFTIHQIRVAHHPDVIPLLFEVLRMGLSL
jgi:hypothetical protein